MRLRWGLAVLLTASSYAAEARVFNYKDSSDFAAYVRGTGALSGLSQDAFANAAGSGVSVNGTSKYDYGAEAGFVLSFSTATHLRIGAEIIQYAGVNGPGANASGVKQYDLSSSVFVFNPNLVLEHVWSVAGPLRYYGALGAGYANVSAVNDYKMASGSSLGVSDFKESMEANTLSATAAFGLETLFSDNATFLAEAGYRYLPVRTLKYKDDATGFSGAVHKGDVVLNSDGSKRTLNLGGVFVGVSFRFYLNFM